MAVVNVKDLYDVIDFMAALGTAVEASFASGKSITLADLPNLFPALYLAIPAIEGIENVPVTIKAMSPEDVAKMEAYVATKLNLQDKKAQDVIEDALRVVMEIWLFVNKYFITVPVPANGTTANNNASAV